MYPFSSDTLFAIQTPGLRRILLSESTAAQAKDEQQLTYRQRTDCHELRRCSSTHALRVPLENKALTGHSRSATRGSSGRATPLHPCTTGFSGRSKLARVDRKISPFHPHNQQIVRRAPLEHHILQHCGHQVPEGQSPTRKACTGQPLQALFVGGAAFDQPVCI